MRRTLDVPRVMKVAEAVVKLLLPPCQSRMWSCA